MAGLLDQVIADLRLQYGPQWEGLVGLPVPEMPVEPPPVAQPRINPPPLREPSGFGNFGPESHQRAMDDARRGFTREGMGMVDALGNAMGATSGFGALTTGVGTMAERLAGLEQGSLGGLKDIRGYSQYDQRVIDAVRTGKIKDKAGMNTMQRDIDTAKRGASMSAGANRGHAGGGYGGGGLAGRSSGGSSRGSRGE